MCIKMRHRYLPLPGYSPKKLPLTLTVDAVSVALALDRNWFVIPRLADVTLMVPAIVTDALTR